MSISPVSGLQAAKLIVSPTAGQGNYTTIASAIAAASSGDTILIKPGTYTENLTLKDGVNLCALGNDQNASGKVIISGKAIDNGSALNCDISGITLQTNSDYVVSLTAASSVNLDKCYINATNNTAFSMTHILSNIRLLSSNGDLGTTGIAFFTTSNGTFWVFNSQITNTGATTTASNLSSGAFVAYGSQFQFPFSTTATGAFGTASLNTIKDCIFDNSTTNTTCITTAGTVSHYFEDCQFYSGTASAISVGAGTTVNLFGGIVNSSNTNAITGAGTLNYGLVTFTGSSSTINTSVQTPIALLVKQGGTAASSFTAYAPVCGGTTTTGALASADSGISNSGYVLTSTGASSLPTWQAAAGSGVTTIDGDSGSATGSTITFAGLPHAGATVTFQASAAQVDLYTCDANGNLILGEGSGNGSISGFSAVIIGQGAGTSLSSGNANVAVGNSSLPALQTGSFNVAIGTSAAVNYTGAESSNILLNSDGVVGESNVLRIGKNTGTGNEELQSAFIQGIASVAVSNQEMVVIDTTTGQLGSQAVPSGSITITGDTGGGLTGSSFTFTGGTTGLSFGGATSTETLSGTLVIANGGTNATSMSTSTGIVKYDGTRLVTSSTAKIDSSDRQTNTSQPAFQAYLSSADSNQTGDGTVFQIGSGNVYTISLDQNSNFVNTGTFTAPLTGTYAIFGDIQFTSITTAVTQLTIRFVATGGTIEFDQNYITGAGFNYENITHSTIMQMTAGDTVVMKCSAAGTTKTVGIASGLSQTAFSGYLIC